MKMCQFTGLTPMNHGLDDQLLFVFFSTLGYCLCFNCSKNIKNGTFGQGGDPCEVVPPSIDHSRKKTQYCNLDSKKIDKIPTNIINYQKLVLLLKRNEIKAIRLGQLNHLSRCVKICLDRNRIKKIEDGSFRNLSSLEVISLYGNKLQRLQAGLWKGLFNLKYLNLQLNQIKVIEHSALSSMKELSYLSLKNNRIRRVSGHMWEGLHNLRYLYIDYNQIARLEKAAFFPLKSLLILSLGSNRLEEINSPWEGLSQLHELNLYDNKIRSVSGHSFKPLTALSRLVLGENKLFTNYLCIRKSKCKLEGEQIINKTSYGTHFVQMFTHKKNISFLSIADNIILNLKKVMFIHFEYLAELLIENCQINDIEEGTFSKQASLLKLDLTGNRLQIIVPEMWKGLTKLVELRLKDNKIKYLTDGAFQPLQSLIKLHLHNNHISYINSSSWKGLYRLEVINLYGNYLTRIETGTFQDLHRCKHIFLQCNRITEISEGGLEGLKNLESLDVRNNALDYFNYTFIDNDLMNQNTSSFFVAFEHENNIYGNFCLCKMINVSFGGIYQVKKVPFNARTNQCTESYLCCNPVDPWQKEIETKCGIHNYSDLGDHGGETKIYCKHQDANFSFSSIQLPISNSLTTPTAAETTVANTTSEYTRSRKTKKSQKRKKSRKKQNQDSAQPNRDQYMIGMSFVGPCTIIILSITSFVIWRLRKNCKNEKRRREKMAREAENLAELECINEMEESSNRKRAGQHGTDTGNIRTQPSTSSTVPHQQGQQPDINIPTITITSADLPTIIVTDADLLVPRIIITDAEAKLPEIVVTEAQSDTHIN